MFDARQARLLKPGDYATYPEAPGLRLVRSAAGWAWIYRYKSPADGRMRQAKLGQWPALSWAGALGAWEAARNARSEGRDLAAERRAARVADRTIQAAAARPAVMATVGELVDHWAAEVAGPGRAPKGRRELARTLATMLPDDVRALQPAQVTRAVAYDLIASHAGTPVQAGNLRRELGACWDWALDAGRLGDEVPNWWRQVLRGKLASRGKIVAGEHQGAPVKRVLSLAEVQAIIAHLPHISRLVEGVLTLYLWTGCRGAEIVAMEGREIQQRADGWWWVIPRAKLKMARHPLATDLPVPLIGRALDVVRTRLAAHGQGWLWPSRPKSKLPHVDQKVIGVEVYNYMPHCTLRPETVRPRWPVTDWAPHDLRRTVRTHLAAMGCPAEVAEAVLGHLPTGVVGVYDRHDYAAERREWLTRLAARWEKTE